MKVFVVKHKQTNHFMAKNANTGSRTVVKMQTKTKM